MKLVKYTDGTRGTRWYRAGRYSLRLRWRIKLEFERRAA